jgi:hypothetical protein
VFSASKTQEEIVKRVIAPIVTFLSLIVSQAIVANVGGDTHPDAAAAGANLKAGWSEPRIAAFVGGCVTAIMIPAKRTYEARDAQAGHTGKEFPEAEVRSSIEPMCTCLALRIAQTWSFDEYISSSGTLMQPLITEALSGGRCKPEGIVGEALAHAKEKNEQDVVPAH